MNYHKSFRWIFTIWKICTGFAGRQFSRRSGEASLAKFVNINQPQPSPPIPDKFGSNQGLSSNWELFLSPGAQRTAQTVGRSRASNGRLRRPPGALRISYSRTCLLHSCLPPEFHRISRVKSTSRVYHRRTHVNELMLARSTSLPLEEPME